MRVVPSYMLEYLIKKIAQDWRRIVYILSMNENVKVFPWRYEMKM